MEDIKIEGTAKTPEVEFKANEGELLIKGRSIP
ncbi:MAG: nuclear pore complex subunit, partial [Flavobacteriales bacterium]